MIRQPPLHHQNPSRLMNWNPVSYTHLDVYKRQVERSMSHECCKGTDGSGWLYEKQPSDRNADERTAKPKAPGDAPICLEDVYKRQRQDKSLVFVMAIKKGIFPSLIFDN